MVPFGVGGAEDAFFHQDGDEEFAGEVWVGLGVGGGGQRQRGQDGGHREQGAAG